MTTLSSSSLRSLEFIRAAQNPDGGWGYRAGGQSFVEPTAFALLALGPRGGACAATGLTFLTSCLQKSGAVGTNPNDTAGNWMAYAALLAFRACGAAAEERRIREWALGFKDASGKFTATDLAVIAKRYKYDASIQGWPWTPDTTAWIEPTALFLIALLRSGVTKDHPRVRAGVDLIIDRKVPSGGWNFGNPYSKSHELEANLMPTALALLALAAAEYPEDGPGVVKGVRFLERGLEGDVSTASLAWSLLALQCRSFGNSMISTVSARLSGLQEENGGFRANPFETALSVVALETPDLIVQDTGKGRS